jgi:hypothetical protein
MECYVGLDVSLTTPARCALLCPECSRLSPWSVAPPAEKARFYGWSGSRGPGRGIQDPVVGDTVRMLPRTFVASISTRTTTARTNYAGRVAAPHARVPTSVRATELSDLHMLVLGRIEHRAIADVEDIARWLGLPVAIADAVCADLEAAGLLARVRRH